MDITFALRGIEGHVYVTYSRNSRPDLVGSSAESSGFPMCHAAVDYPAQGYDALLGWVQLVRSDDNTSQGRAFEIDPLDILGDVPHPFCWIGLSPRLFDAPSRSPRRDLDWVAQSFLCVPDGSVGAGLEVRRPARFRLGIPHPRRGDTSRTSDAARTDGLGSPSGRSGGTVSVVALHRRLPRRLNRSHVG